jgi:hypothetical protein
VLHKNKVTHFQLIFLINLFVVLLVSFIFILNNPTLSNIFIDKDKYLNPLLINKSLQYHMKTNNFEKFDIWLVNKKTNINIINGNGNNLLMTAISNNYDISFIQKLAIRTNKLYISDDNLTPIKISIIFDNFEAFRILLRNKYYIKNINDVFKVLQKAQISNKSKYYILLKNL